MQKEVVVACQPHSSGLSFLIGVFICVIRLNSFLFRQVPSTLMHGLAPYYPLRRLSTIVDTINHIHQEARQLRFLLLDRIGSVS